MKKWNRADEKKHMNTLTKVIFYFIQWTWGLPVNLLGGILFLIFKLRGCEHERFYESFIVHVPWNQGGLSLGQFVFMKANHENKDWTYNTRIHEYGHTWQCLLLGPLYYPIIGIPSAVWNQFFRNYRKKNNVSYYVFYPEKWANVWGEKFTGLRMRESNL